LKCGNEVQLVKNERKQTRRNFQTRSKAGIGFIQTKGYGQICTYARTFNKMDHLKTRPAQYVIFWATGLMLMDILWEKGKT
jgi:hypothetical protein